MDDERDGLADSDPEDTDGSQTRGTFLVIRADDETAVVRDVNSGRVHALSENSGVEASDVLEENQLPEEGDTLDEGDVIEATIAPEPPLELAWELCELHDRRSIPLEGGSEPPTSRMREIASQQDEGEVTRTQRAGTGEIHVLTVPADRTQSAVTDVLEDEATRERAARLGVARVEVRADDGVVSVRYLP